MKYFTIATLTLLAANAYASTSPEPGNAEKPFYEKALSDIKEFFDEAGYAISGIFTKKPENLIKADLVEPTPIDANQVVRIDPTENICVAGNETEYWDSLYGKTDSKDIEKMIFCPNALGYLGKLDQVTLTGRASGEKLRDILVALKLRRETLTGAYLDSYMVDGFLECFKQLKAKLQGEADPWPCADSTKCDAQSIQSNFAGFVDATRECKDVLKDQLSAYATKVAEAATANNLKTSSSVRSAILTNLNSTPHLSLSFRFLYDKAAEREKALAAARIEQVIADACAILDKQSEGKSTVCADAQAVFTARLEAIKPKEPKPATQTPESKTEETKTEDTKATNNQTTNNQAIEAQTTTKNQATETQTTNNQNVNSQATNNQSSPKSEAPSTSNTATPTDKAPTATTK